MSEYCAKLEFSFDEMVALRNSLRFTKATMETQFSIFGNNSMSKCEFDTLCKVLDKVESHL